MLLNEKGHGHRVQTRCLREGLEAGPFNFGIFSEESFQEGKLNGMLFTLFNLSFTLLFYHESEYDEIMKV